MSDKSSHDEQLSPTDAFQPTEHHPHASNSQGHLSIAPGSVIEGRYRIVKLIGEGGMGSVWEAEQFAPVKRRVAVKFIKQGLVSTGTLARFHSERQALAIMDHPNVARFVDGGDTDFNLPFVVMDYIDGAPIIKFCDQNKLTIEQRIDLILEVCDAVQHAHERGIVHRDLKPSNILVSATARGPRPKVVDFGIAKAIDASSTFSEMADLTMLDRVVGTPMYMAPEQIDRDFGPIDERTDVYGLGCVLYELLCGMTVLDSSIIKKASLLETQKLICNNEFEQPAQRLKSSDKAGEIADNRSVTVQELERRLKGDLQNIAMKTLAKPKADRYASAADLAADLRRYKEKLPVQARSKSFWINIRNWIIRYRLQIIIAELVGIVLVIAMGINHWRATRDLQANSSVLLYFAIDAHNDGRFDDAIELAKQCLETREWLQPDDWTTFNARSYLGAFQAETDQRDKAEQNLLTGFEGMRKRVLSIPADVRSKRMRAAIQRIIDFYRANDRKTEVDAWTRRLEEYPLASDNKIKPPSDQAPAGKALQ